MLAVGIASFSMLQSMINPVLPELQRDLHASQSTVTWVVTSYLLAASVFTPIVGRIGDTIGKKRVLVAALVVLALGSFLAALASSIAVMIAGRVVQGVGGGIIPLSFGIVRDEFPPEKVMGVIGVLASLLAAAGGLGLVVAGPIIDLFDYHWLFWIPGVVVAGAAVATYLVVPESRDRAPGRVNAWPALLLSGWLVALLLAVSKAPDWGWASSSVIGLELAAMVVAAAWWLVEMRSRRPLIDMGMMRLPAVWTTNLVALLFGAGMYSMLAFLPAFVQTSRSAGYGFGASVAQSGLILLPLATTMFIVGGYNGRLSARFGSNVVLVAGSLLSVGPYVALGSANDHVWQVMLALTVLGIGFGLAFAAMANIIVDSVPSSQTAVASGMNANIRTIGGSIGAAVMASIVASSAHGAALPAESGYRTGFLVLAAVTVLAAAAGLLIPRVGVVRDQHRVEQGALAHPAVALVAGAAIVGDEPE